MISTLSFRTEANVNSVNEQTNYVIKEISKWRSSKQSTFKTIDGVSSFKAYIKYNKNPNGGYPIASITNFKTNSNKISAKEIINTLKEALDLKKWDEQRRLEDVNIYGVYLKPLKRYVRVFIRTKNGFTQYSTATFKESSLVKLSVETEVLQRALFGLYNKKSRRFVWNKLINHFIISEARATKLPDTKEISDAISDKANEAVSAINRKIKLAGKDVEKVSKYLKENGEQVYQQLENIVNGPVGQTVQGISELGEGVNRLSKLFSSPGKLFLSSAAVALGSLSVSIVSSGIGQLGEFLWELFTGEKNKKLLIKKFNDNKEKWNKYQKSYNELEDLFKNTLKLLKNATQMNIKETDIDKMEALQLITKEQIGLGKERLREFINENNSSCAKKEANKIVNLTNIERTVSGLIQFGKTKKDEDGRSAICENLESILSRLITIDSELLKARDALIDPNLREVWQELWHDSEWEQRENLKASQNKGKYKKVFEDRIKFLKERHKKDLGRLKMSFLNGQHDCATKKIFKSCTKNLSDKFKINQAVLGIYCAHEHREPAAYGNARNSCFKQYRNKHKDLCIKKSSGEYEWTGNVDSKNYFFNKCLLKIEYWAATKDAKDRLERNLQTLNSSNNQSSNGANDRAYKEHMNWFDNLKENQINKNISLTEKRNNQKAELEILCK